jgi:hypothetical protein
MEQELRAKSISSRIANCEIAGFLTTEISFYYEMQNFKPEI